MKQFTVKEATDLKTFTDNTYPQGSFYYNILLRGGDIRVNGNRVRNNLPLHIGDIVTYYTTQKQEANASHLTCFENDVLYVADKVSGVSCEALACELGYIPVHRIDRNTAGLLVFAKDRRTADDLMALFKERAVEKKYLCFAKNAFKREGELLTAYLYKDARASKVTVSDTPKRGFVPISTEYRVLKGFGDYALVEVTLHTGKTHQIRAHLAHIGCPLLGDEKYGDEALNKKYAVTRQCLVSKHIAFKYRGQTYSFTSSFVPELPNR